MSQTAPPAHPHPQPYAFLKSGCTRLKIEIFQSAPQDPDLQNAYGGGAEGSILLPWRACPYTLRQRSENWYLGVFWGEEAIATTFEIPRAQEVDATDDDEKNHKRGIPLIACTLKQRSENWYRIVFWGEESIATTPEIIRVQKVNDTEDENNHKNGMPLIDFITSSEYTGLDSALARSRFYIKLPSTSFDVERSMMAQNSWVCPS